MRYINKIKTYALTVIPSEQDYLSVFASRGIPYICHVKGSLHSSSSLDFTRGDPERKPNGSDALVVGRDGI